MNLLGTGQELGSIVDGGLEIRAERHYALGIENACVGRMAKHPFQ